MPALPGHLCPNYVPLCCYQAPLNPPFGALTPTCPHPSFHAVALICARDRDRPATSASTVTVLDRPTRSFSPTRRATPTSPRPPRFPTGLPSPGPKPRRLPSHDHRRRRRRPRSSAPAQVRCQTVRSPARPARSDSARVRHVATAATVQSETATMARRRHRWHSHPSTHA